MSKVLSTYCSHGWKSFQAALVVKSLPTSEETQDTQVQSLGLENPLEEDMATHSSPLAWRIPWTEEPGGLQSMGVTQSWTWLKWLSTAHSMWMEMDKQTQCFELKLEIWLAWNMKASLVAQLVKRIHLQWRRPRFDPWVRKIPREGNGNPLQYSCLGSPMHSRAWQALVHGVAKSQTQLSN